jgi:hypothetical protein
MSNVQTFQKEKNMLNIRTTSLSVVLLFVLAFAVRLTATKTQATSAPANSADSIQQSQELSIPLKNSYVVPTYRSQFGECFDVSITDQVSCHAASVTHSEAYTRHLDECFDVSLLELAACRNESQAFAP